jgi:RNA polymerase sigma-70 factor, ECF subfamily
MDPEVEKDLVRQAQKDPQAFAQLYDHYYPIIFGYVLRRTANLEAAQDITSETFFKALRGLGRFRWRNVPFCSWLYRIASNETSQYFRQPDYKRSKSLEEIQEQGFEPVSPVDPGSELVEAQERLERHRDFLRIQARLARLPAKYQEVIALRFFEEKQIKEIAQVLGKKEGTVKSLLHRAVEKLRETE